MYAINSDALLDNSTAELFVTPTLIPVLKSRYKIMPVIPLLKIMKIYEAKSKTCGKNYYFHTLFHACHLLKNMHKKSNHPACPCQRVATKI